MTELDYSTPEEVHALGIQAIQLYNEGNKTLGEAALAQLSQGLTALRQDLQQLLHAIAGLGAAALYLEQQGDAPTAEKLKALMSAQAPLFERIKEQLTEQLQDQAEGTAAQAKSLIGAEKGPRTAPRYDAPAPKGTTRLSDLMPNPALRPPSPRKK
jgi:hypothetical protein